MSRQGCLHDAEKAQTREIVSPGSGGRGWSAVSRLPVRPVGPAGGSLPDREVFSLLAARWSCLGGVAGFRGAAGAAASSAGAAVMGLDAAVIGLDSYTGDAHRPKASERLQIDMELRLMQLLHDCQGEVLETAACNMRLLCA